MRAAVLAIVGFMVGVNGGAAAAKSCRDTAGFKFAQKLTHQCLEVSATSSPPCSEQTSCDEMLDLLRATGYPLPPEDSAYWTAAVPADHPILNGGLAFCREYFDVVGEFSPSFDCAKAQSVTEKMICASRELSGLDSRLASMYRQALATESTSEAEQRAWLKRRDAVCGADREDKCLADAMQKRRMELYYNDMGVSASPPPRALTYRDLIGTWEARAVRVFSNPGAVVSLSDDDPKYLGVVVAFEPDRIVWLKGTEERPSRELDTCDKPTIAALNAPPTDPFDVVHRDHGSYEKIPGGYAARCGEKPWGPGAVVKGVSADNVRLYWYDGAILTLKRVKN